MAFPSGRVLFVNGPEMRLAQAANPARADSITGDVKLHVFVIPVAIKASDASGVNVRV